MNTQENQVVIFVGRSGCGKGTQADLLQEKLKGKVVYVGTGEYFRSMLKGDSLTATLYREAYEKGELAPNFLITAFLGNTFIEKYTGDENIIFDGVARLQPEADALTEMMVFYKVKNPKVIYIDVSSDWALDKAQKRGRADDKGAKTKDQWFEHQVKPVIEFLKHNPVYTFIHINGEQSIEDVHKEIVSKL